MLGKTVRPSPSQRPRRRRPSSALELCPVPPLLASTFPSSAACPAPRCRRRLRLHRSGFEPRAGCNAEGARTSRGGVRKAGSPSRSASAQREGIPLRNGSYKSWPKQATSPADCISTPRCGSEFLRRPTENTAIYSLSTGRFVTGLTAMPSMIMVALSMKFTLWDHEMTGREREARCCTRSPSLHSPCT